MYVYLVMHRLLPTYKNVPSQQGYYNPKFSEVNSTCIAMCSLRKMPPRKQQKVFFIFSKTLGHTQDGQQRESKYGYYFFLPMNATTVICTQPGKRRSLRQKELRQMCCVVSSKPRTCQEHDRIKCTSRGREICVIKSHFWRSIVKQIT